MDAKSHVPRRRRPIWRPTTPALVSGFFKARSEIVVPGTKLGLSRRLSILREIFGVHPKRVRGDVVLGPEPGRAPGTVTILVSLPVSSPTPRHLTSSVNDPQAVPQLPKPAPFELPGRKHNRQPRLLSLFAPVPGWPDVTYPLLTR